MEGYTLTTEVDQKFLEGMKDYICIVIKEDNTVNLRTSTMDLEQLKAIFSAAYLMVSSHIVGTEDEGVDKYH